MGRISTNDLLFLSAAQHFLFFTKRVILKRSSTVLRIPFSKSFLVLPFNLRIQPSSIRLKKIHKFSFKSINNLIRTHNIWAEKKLFFPLINLLLFFKELCHFFHLKTFFLYLYKSFSFCEHFQQSIILSHGNVFTMLV